MGSFNKQIVLGYLCKDAEVKTIPGGKEIVEFSLYTKEYQGKDKDLKTEFFDVSTFLPSALTSAKNGRLTKGTQLYVEGKNESRDFESKGVKQRRWTIRATEMRFVANLGNGDEGDGNGNGHAAQPTNRSSNRTQAGPPQQQAQQSAVDDDCPF